MIEGADMSKESASDRLRVALVGEQKVGKSTLFSTAPGIKLDIDFDQRRNALAGKKDTYAITLSDPQFPKMPEAVEDCFDIISGLERSLDLSELVDKNNKRILPDVPKGTVVENIAFDSIQSMAKACANFEMYNNADLRREISIGSGTRAIKVYIQKNFDAWNAEMKTVESLIMRAFALPINVFCMFHETAEEAPDSTLEKIRLTGRITVFPVRYKNLLQYFSEVWRLKLAPGSTSNAYTPKVYPLPDYSLNAATAMKLDAIEEPDIAAMIKKHHDRVSGKVGMSQGLAPNARIAGLSK